MSPVGFRHAWDCPNVNGTADPWQADLIRAVTRRWVNFAGHVETVRYECPLCHRAAIRTEPAPKEDA